MQQQHPAGPDGAEIRVEVVRSARRRTMAIHVDARGEVEVRVPLWTGRSELAGFVERNRDWIRRKVAEAQAAPFWIPCWAAGGEWYWRGERLRLTADVRGRGLLLPGEIRLPLPLEADAAAWRDAVFAWHRRESAVLLTARVQDLFAAHGGSHRLRTVAFRWMRATWGTCGGRRAADGRRDVVIRLNPWLAALPPVLSDAVLFHELAHVEHMHHGPGFYRRLAALDPQWREHDRELKVWARRLFPVREP